MKSNFKTTLNSMIATALIAATGSSLLAPREANAAIGVVGLAFNPIAGLKVMAVGGGLIGAALVYGAGVHVACHSGNHCDEDNWGIWINIPFWLGVVVLDQHVTSVPTFDKQDLLDNGYKERDANQIMSDALKFNDILKQKQQALSMTSHETLDSIRGGIKQIFPEASDAFLKYYSEKLLITAQTQTAKDASSPSVSSSSEETYKGSQPEALHYTTEEGAPTAIAPK